jgi:type I restriction enzyme M protein
LTYKAIEGLRFVSGDEQIRSKLYDRFGERLVEDFKGVETQVVAVLSEWTSEADESEDGEHAENRISLSDKRKKKLLDANTWQRDDKLVRAAMTLRRDLGDGLFEDHNLFRDEVAEVVMKHGIRLNASDLKTIYKTVSHRVDKAPPVIKKIHKRAKPDPLHGLFEIKVGGKTQVVEFEPDSELRDFEKIPLLEDGGIVCYFHREVLPHIPDAWIDPDATRIGYEISFTRHFYKPQRLRTLAEIRADIEALERQTEGLLENVLVNVEGAA